MFIKALMIIILFFAKQMDCSQALECKITSIEQKKVDCDKLTDGAILKFFTSGSMALQPMSKSERDHIFLRDPLDQNPGRIYHPSIMTIEDKDGQQSRYNILFVKEQNKETERLYFAKEDVQLKNYEETDQKQAILCSVVANTKTQYVMTQDNKHKFHVSLSVACLKRLLQEQNSSFVQVALRFGGHLFYPQVGDNINIDHDFVSSLAVQDIDHEEEERKRKMEQTEEFRHYQKPQSIPLSPLASNIRMTHFVTNSLLSETEQYAILICNNDDTFSLRPHGKEAFVVNNLVLPEVPNKPFYIKVKNEQNIESSYNVTHIIRVNKTNAQSLAFAPEDVTMEQPLSRKSDGSPVYAIQGESLYCMLRMRNDNVHLNGIYWHSNKRFLALTDLPLNILQTLYSVQKDNNRTAKLKLFVGGLCFEPNNIDIDENFLKEAQQADENKTKEKAAVDSMSASGSRLPKTAMPSYINRYTIGGLAGIAAILFYYFNSEAFKSFFINMRKP